VSPLTEAQVTAGLAQTPGWKRAGNAIERTYRFPDFNAAMVFVNWVAALAERANHHPDMTIHYNEVTVSVWNPLRRRAHGKRLRARPRDRRAVTTLALPELFGDRFAALEEQFLTTTTGDLFADCFGCGPSIRSACGCGASRPRRAC
jgi:4a-hydroxytetrahydrobiopterin dehydratase